MSCSQAHLAFCCLQWNEANILASLDTFMLMLFSFLQLIDKHKGGMGG